MQEFKLILKENDYKMIRKEAERLFLEKDIKKQVKDPSNFLAYCYIQSFLSYCRFKDIVLEKEE